MRVPARATTGLLALAAVLAGGLASAAPAGAQGATDQGWWSIAHRADLSGAGAPPPPAAPDVGEDDLLLQGGDPFSVLPAGSSPQPPMPSALAALRFALPPGAVLGRLVLPVAAGGTAAGVVAFTTHDGWQPVQNGAYEQAPVPDTSRAVPGVLSADGTSLVFSGIGALQDGGVLSVVLVPGATDRVVVHAPPATALEVAAGPALPPAVTAPAPGSSPAPAPLPVTVLPVLAAGPAQPGAAAPAALVAAAAPAPAVAAAPYAQPVVATQLTRVRKADDVRTRWFVGAELLLVALMFGLLGVGPLGRLAAVAGPLPDAEDGARGVGRFRAVRSGPVPRL